METKTLKTGNTSEIKIRKRRMGYNVPFEMQVEIIKKLPVKSLAVFRSVSKAWKSLIDSPLFITDYTNLRQHHRLLIRYEVSNTFEPKYVSMVDNDTLSRQTVSNVPVSFQLLKELELVGTSQGLLCLFGYTREDNSLKQRAVIWNPSLGKSIIVDVPFLYSIGLIVFGFGVRPDNFDPMIVMVSRVAHSKPFMVFTLSSRVWRVPRGNLPPKSIYFPNRSQVATHDQCIYWKAYERQRDINLVVGFDMVSEVFTEINLPHCVAHRYSCDISIFKIKESLAVLEYDRDAKKRVYGVWIMVEDGFSKSFTKLFTINTPDASLRTKFIIGFRNNGQPIMATTTDAYGVYRSLEIYEPRSGYIKKLGNHYLSFCCSYTETLLLLDQLDEQFVKIQLQL